MNIILLGAPGAGKGTQARFICDFLNIPSISTGDMLRAEIASSSKLGREIKSIIEAGVLVPDQLIIQLVRMRIAQKDCAQGFLLDGFPRTIPQAEALKQASVAISHVIEIAVADEEIIRRITGRRIHVASGRIYHIEYNPPKQQGKDDLTGERLVQRADDTEATIRERLRIYYQQTAPLIQFYQKSTIATQYYKILGMAPVETIRQEIQGIFSAHISH